ncbi:hypothetical protein [Pedobacter sp. L105]|uniref:hypothetical protein n=1 Tax=Pedobacter sp. L105 TaxID=1641871 RepID=UPI00131BFBED|nr:hypothetical protein [Pedobacter sp. L105]
MIAKVLKFPEITKEESKELKWFKVLQPEILFLVLVLIWFLMPFLLHFLDPTAGDIDQSHWFLILLGLITFLILLSICSWLFRHFWEKIGLPEIKTILLKFNYLTPWQQLNFLSVSFFLLLLAAVGCLIGIC